MNTKTITTISRAEQILGKCTNPQLVEIYLHAFDGISTDDQTGWMAAAKVRGWVEQALETRGEMHLLTTALNVCPLCWTGLEDNGDCRECLDDAHEAELKARVTA